MEGIAQQPLLIDNHEKNTFELKDKDDSCSFKR